MSTAPAVPAPRKSLWDTVLGSTPVVLTVLATILAGLSSGEMTRAQYHRSLAAQDQSKTSDEWAFFQAKKYRSAYAIGTATQLRLESSRQPFTAGSLVALLDGMVDDLQSLDGRVGELLTFLQSNEALLGDRGKKYHERLTALRQGVKERVQKLKDAKEALVKDLDGADIQRTFQILPSDELPLADGTGKAADVLAGLTNDLKDINPAILEACQAIDTNKPKKDLDALCNRITEEQVRQAEDKVQEHIVRFDFGHRPVARTQDRIGKVLDECLELQSWAREAASDLHLDAGSPALTGDDKPWGRFQASLTALARDTEEENAAAARRGADFAAARLRYNARRYDHEAAYNQRSAWLHEIQVNKSGLLSERHRYRSSLFFIGMLAAQGGVTIATLSLALRQRSILWTLATLAGLAAITLAGYVYLFI